METLFADTMSRVDFEPALFSHKRQVFTGPNAAVVEEHVVVGAQAEDVVRGVGKIKYTANRVSSAWVIFVLSAIKVFCL